MKLIQNILSRCGWCGSGVSGWPRYVGEFGRVGLATVAAIGLLMALAETAVPGIVVNRFAPSWLIGFAALCVAAQLIDSQPPPTRRWSVLAGLVALTSVCLVAWYCFGSLAGRHWTVAALAVILLGGAILFRRDRQ